MDIKLLIIKLVEKYDCLYNVHSPQNKNFVYKQYLWDEIGKEVGISGSTAKREFKTVRDNYKKWQNKRLSEYGFHKQYKYAEYLKFLDDHMVFRRSVPTKTSMFLPDIDINSDVSNNLSLQFPMSTDLKLKLIEYVKQHDCIYNIYSPLYNNFEYKEQLWNQFEQELGISAEHIKNMWLNLIDCYKKQKQNAHGKYLYAENLKFLDDYILPESEPNNETFIISFIDDENDADNDADYDDDNDMDNDADYDDDNDDDNKIVSYSPNNLDLLVELKTDINIKIIEAVQNYDCLYNLNSFQNKDFDYKKEVWNQIGKETGISADLAKRRWKSIKDYYRKCKISGDTHYKYAEYLTFLDEFMVIPSQPIEESISLIDEEIVTESSNDVELLDNSIDTCVQLIEAVKPHKCLYDALTPQYKNYDYKQELWNQIGKDVGMAPKAVRKKWQSIKEYYVKYKQNRMKSYKYSDYLKFLDDFITMQSYEEVSTDLHLQIIEEVKKYKCLYDPQSVRFKDFEYRQKIWYNIAKKLGISIENVKGKWKHVKDYYKRCKLTPNTKYKYADNLKFLDSYIVIQSKGVNETISLVYAKKETDLSNGINVIEEKYPNINTNVNVLTDINIILIEAVKKYDCLYNELSPKYKDIKYKQKLWNKIGKELGKSKKYVKKKWNNLMYRYKKCKEKILENGGYLEQYKYMENMKFLDDNIVLKRVDQNSSQLLPEPETNTDLSSDTDLLYIPPIKKEKFEHSPKDFQDFLENPISTRNSNQTENPKITINQGFENENIKSSSSKMLNFLNKPKKDSKSNTSERFEKVNFENSLDEVNNFSAEPISTKNLENAVNLKSLKRKSFENSLEEEENLSENSIPFETENKKSTASQLFEKENSEKVSEEKHHFGEEPISTKNLNKIEKNPKSSTSQWFELLAKKINESNITAEQKNDIEFAVSSIVYSKLAEYSK